MLILVEGLAMCFLLLLVCVVGISNGPIGSVYFFEQDVQDRVVELGLTTKEEIKRDHATLEKSFGNLISYGYLLSDFPCIEENNYALRPFLKSLGVML